MKNDVWSYDVSTGAWSLLMNEVASTSDAAAAFARFSAAAGGDAGGRCRARRSSSRESFVGMRYSMSKVNSRNV